MITESKKIRNVVKIFAVLAAVAAVATILGDITNYCIGIFGYGEPFGYYLELFLQQGIWLVFRLAIAFSLFLAATLNKKWMLAVSLVLYLVLNGIFAISDIQDLLYYVKEMLRGDFGMLAPLIWRLDGFVSLLPLAVSILAVLLIKKGKANKAFAIISSILNVIAVGFFLLLSAYSVVMNIVDFFKYGRTILWAFQTIVWCFADITFCIFYVMIFISVIVIMLGGSGIIKRKKKEKTETAAVEEETKTAETGYVVTYAEPSKPEAQELKEEKMPETKEAKVAFAFPPTLCRAGDPSCPYCLPLEGKVGFAQQNSDEVEKCVSRKHSVLHKRGEILAYLPSLHHPTAFHRLSSCFGQNKRHSKNTATQGKKRGVFVFFSRIFAPNHPQAMDLTQMPGCFSVVIICVVCLCVEKTILCSELFLQIFPLRCCKNRGW